MFRSQVSEAFYNKYKKDDSLAVSCGTWVRTEGFEGRVLSSLVSVYPGIKHVFILMEEYELDISASVCTQATNEFLKDADKIVVMAERDFIPEWLNKFNYEYWEGIGNPDSLDKKTAENIIELIRIKVLKLLEN